MKNLLVLVHRIPYPPKKGDKVRTFNIVRCLSQHYRVYLGAFVDDEEDWQYTSEVQRLCEEAHFCELHSLTASLRSLGGFFIQ